MLDVKNGARRSVVVAVAILATLVHTADAQTPAQGPVLQVPAATLQAALDCPQPLHDLARDPVLLVPATTVTPEENYSFNFAKALPRAGLAYCTVRLPDRSMADLQVASEYVTHAIREMNSRSGRKVAVIGHSQGGLEPRWALRFWPDLPGKVSDYVSFGTPQHGTGIVNATFCAGPCAPALWQMRSGSEFEQALNRGRETFPPTDYTSIYTQTDQFVQPQPRVSSIAGAANVSVQAICPGHVVDHVNLVVDPVVYAITMDALTHDGPAVPRRIDRASCGQAVPPGVDPAAFAVGIANAYRAIAVTIATYPTVDREPQLTCYALGIPCPHAIEQATMRLVLRVNPRRVRAGDRRQFRFQAVVRGAGISRPAAGARIRIDGKTLRAKAAGTATLMRRFMRVGTVPARASLPGFVSARTSIRVLRPTSARPS